VRKTADELLTTSSEDDKVIIQQQVAQLDATWQSVITASKTRSCRLVEAPKLKPYTWPPTYCLNDLPILK